MNFTERKLNMRRVYNQISKSYNTKEGVIKINTNNTFEHELSKFILCWEIAKNNQSFLTEVIWNNGSRSDIVTLDDATIIEVIHTEKPDGHKTIQYPFPITYITTAKALKKAKEIFLNQ